MNEQLYALSRPFPAKYIQAPAPGKYGDYVKHSTVTERLLYDLGPYSFEIIELIRDPDDSVTGCLARLTVFIDDREVTIVEAGDVEHGERHSNGSAAKDAASDALKRCAMRIGIGLHLWSGNDFYLARALRVRDGHGEDDE